MGALAVTQRRRDEKSGRRRKWDFASMLGIKGTPMNIEILFFSMVSATT
jgi:hypothetical protein